MDPILEILIFCGLAASIVALGSFMHRKDTRTETDPPTDPSESIPYDTIKTKLERAGMREYAHGIFVAPLPQRQHLH